MTYGAADCGKKQGEIFFSRPKIHYSCSRGLIKYIYLISKGNLSRPVYIEQL